MPEKQSSRLSRLLTKNGEGNLTENEKEELGSLMQINRLNDLRKAIGIVEAIKRGLIKSAEELAWAKFQKSWTRKFAPKQKSLRILSCAAKTGFLQTRNRTFVSEGQRRRQWRRKFMAGVSAMQFEQRHKNSRVWYAYFQARKIYNLREQVWSEHFAWSKDKTEIIGKTPCGRATVSALQLNSELQRTAREFWKLTGIFPPTD